jgi:hypothetical protein
VLCVAIAVLRVETSRHALEDIAPGDSGGLVVEPGEADAAETVAEH